MTEQELLRLIAKNRSTESEILEFKERRESIPTGKEGSTKRSIYGYCVGIGNEGGGKLLIGISDKGAIVWTHAELPNDIKKRIFQKTKQKIAIETIHTSQGKVIVINIPSRQPNQVLKFNGIALMRIDDGLAEMSDEKLREILNENIIEDRSIGICEEATFEDLSLEAIAKARELYLVKHPNKKTELEQRDNITFLNKAKLTIKGKITRASILLLGNPESTHYLSPATAEISRILKNRDWVEIDYEHFHSPLILSVGKVHSKIRNLKYRYIPDWTLFPEEVDKYDPYIIREALNNCIAHQDYTLWGKIIIVEGEDYLIFSNKGSFIPKTIEHVINSDAPTEYYRNKFLADAMVNLNMIDTIGSWIKRMFTLQKDKFFPLPEYNLTDNKVQLTIIGKVIDLNYAHKLAQFKNLSLQDIMSLDKIQKHKKLTHEEKKSLRQKHLIEGKWNNIYISSLVAENTSQKGEYMKQRGIDDIYCQKMITDYLKKFNKASREDFDNLLIDKLWSLLTVEQKTNKITNNLQFLRRQWVIKVNKGRIRTLYEQ